MSPDPRYEVEYGKRQVDAAHRVLVDIGQVLGSFREAIVVVGGWVPELLLQGVEPAHVGSIDVDLALDAGKLTGGLYAELLKLLVDTRRFRPGAKAFQLVAEVDLQDGGPAVVVELDFLAPADVKVKGSGLRPIESFRVLQFPACSAAFRAPAEIEIVGRMISGATNRVHLRVASLADFLVMKAHAMAGRDKPKDAYDLCFCLENYPGGLERLAADWRIRISDGLVQGALAILNEKFESVGAFGPQQVVLFHSFDDPDERARLARRSFELVQALSALLQVSPTHPPSG